MKYTLLINGVFYRIVIILAHLFVQFTHSTSCYLYTVKQFRVDSPMLLTSYRAFVILYRFVARSFRVGCKKRRGLIYLTINKLSVLYCRFIPLL